MLTWKARSSVAAFCVAVLAGCEVSSDVSLPEEDHLLEDVMESYVSARFRFYPIESTLSGLPGNDDRLGTYSQAAIDARVAWLTDFHHKLMGLRLTRLSQAGYVDALWLTSLVKAELFELEERQRWRRSAAFYGERIRLGLVSLLAESELSSNADALAGRLGDIPRLLEEARENLEPAEPAWRSEGLRSLDACRRLLEDLPAMLEDRVAPHQLAELAGLSRTATRTVQAFIQRLPELQTGAELHAYALGEEALSRYYLYALMVDWPLDDVETRARDELASVTHAMTELALEKFPSETLSAVLAGTPVTEPIESATVAAERRVLELVRERDGASPLDASLPVRRVPDYFPGTDVVQLWRPKALEPGRGAFLMVRDVPGADANEIELLVLREVGGRTRQFVQQAASASLLRRVLVTPTTSEGWLARYERAVLDEGRHPETAVLRIEHYRRSMVELVRLLAVIGIHARGWSLERASESFHELAFLPPSKARAEAERAAVDPSAGDAALGRLLIDDLANDYYRAHPLSAPGTLESRLLVEGLLPVRLLRYQIF